MFDSDMKSESNIKVCGFIAKMLKIFLLWQEEGGATGR